MSKELRSLLVSAEVVAHDTLVDALAGTVSIIEGTGEVMAMPALCKRGLPSQVIAYLLALRAALILGQRQPRMAPLKRSQLLFILTFNAFGKRYLGSRIRL
jgi:hypothetical protein